VCKHENEVLYWTYLAIQHGDAKIRADMNRMRPQVAQIFQQMKAPPAYKPRERKLCGLKTVCYVDRLTARRSGTTNVDCWSDCNTDPRF